VNTHKQVILVEKISQKPVHDIIHAKSLIGQTRRTERYVMDMGYDSEDLHRWIREETGADSVIPV
jgi:hypothetical protein